MTAVRFPKAGLLLAAFLGSCSRPVSACVLLDQLANTGEDSAGALTDCIHRTPAGGILALTPGTYVLKRPVEISRAIALATAHLEGNPYNCLQIPSRCATIVIDAASMPARPRRMPLEVIAEGVTLDHLIIEGSGQEEMRRGKCRSDALRPSGGGIRISGSRFALRNSVLRRFPCYTALEIIKGAERASVEHNVIGPNGRHDVSQGWSDGVTVHDSVGTSVIDNSFIDNTDVQLIFGGCRDCKIESNRFRHSGPFRSASFAEVMLHSWPTTSGNYDGTIVSGNWIDCGSSRRCGYGIMLGSAPWYPGKASGGEVVGNRVSNAMVGINIDSISGPVVVSRNVVEHSGGRFRSDCGVRDWPAVNISPSSRPYIRGDISAGASSSTAGCLLNRSE